MPCSNCRKRETCRSICPLLEARLPAELGEPVGCDDDLRRYGRQKARTRMVLDFRAGLSERQREIVDMIFNRCLPCSEAAREMGVDERTARKMLGSAFARIRRAAIAEMEETS